MVPMTERPSRDRTRERATYACPYSKARERHTLARSRDLIEGKGGSHEPRDERQQRNSLGLLYCSVDRDGGGGCKPRTWGRRPPPTTTGIFLAALSPGNCSKSNCPACLTVKKITPSPKLHWHPYLPSVQQFDSLQRPPAAPLIRNAHVHSLALVHAESPCEGERELSPRRHHGTPDELRKLFRAVHNKVQGVVEKRKSRKKWCKGAESKKRWDRKSLPVPNG